MKRNWSKNIDFSASRFHEPTSVDEVQRLVGGSSTVGVVGAGHSFNDIADTTGDLISLHRLPRRFEVATDRSTVTVDAAIRYGELGPLLHREGLALGNMASMPTFTVAGACATCTHGSGDANQSLAAAVRGLEVVTAGGDLLTAEAGTDELAAMTVGLGACGVITAVTLSVEPAYDMAQDIHLDVDLRQAIDHLDELMADGYSVSMFTNWSSGKAHSLWRKYRLDGATPAIGGEELLGGRRAPSPPAGYHTPAPLIPGPWYERLPHVLMAYPDKPPTQLQSEYFVDRRHGPAALTALADRADRWAPAMTGEVLAEIRTVAADGHDRSWLSPFEKDTLAIHFSWDPDPAALEPVLGLLEETLAPFEARPHWGKLHTMPAEVLRSQYPRFADWVDVVERHDPGGTFRNRFLHALID